MVATQSLVDPAYGEVGLSLMRVGRSGPEALKSVLAGDDGREYRQVAMIDASSSLHSNRFSTLILIVEPTGRAPK